MKISILGDSISTYQGYNPVGYSVFYNEEMQKKNGLESVNDTWWKQLINYYNFDLCSNNSYSGSQVSKKYKHSTNNIERIKLLKGNNEDPDIVLIYIGCNDYIRGTKIKHNNLFSHDINYFYDAYDEMLKNIKKLFPNTKIVCGTLMKSYILDYDKFIFPENYCGIPFEEYNNTIKDLANKNNCFIADLNNQGLRYDTHDGTHPTKLGHMEMCRAWVRCLAKEPKIFETDNKKTII